MDYSTLAVLLLVLGLALLVAEFFIPSGGMIFVMATVCLAGSVWAASKAWWTSSPTFFWLHVGAMVLLIPCVVGGAVFALQRTRLGNRILLEAPSSEEVTPYAEEQRRLSQTVGRPGTTLTMLNPGGMVLVEGERFHCESPGLLIEAGSDVDVIAVKGNRLLVRPAVRRPPPAETPLEGRLADEAGEEPPLDFDFPQS
jgi:membrane-bound ClpP family serine protease